MRNKKEQSLSSSKTNWLSFADKSFFIFAALFIFLFSFFFSIKTNFKPNTPLEAQLYYLNPDAKLYYSIAENITNGVGFEDTARKQMILPSVGHPLLLSAFCIIGKLTPYQFTYIFLFLSAILLILAVKIYTRSNLLAVITFVLYALLCNNFRWLCANVESSIMLSNSLLILSLALLYRYKFKLAFAVITAIALSINILIRPLFLFPLHILFFLLLISFAIIYFKKKEIKEIKSFFILAIITEVIILAVMGISYLKYDDSRLVTGTYGAYSLYAANNPYVPIDKPFDTKWNFPPEYKKMMALIINLQDMTWQKRHQILMENTKEYIKENPVRAIKGWWWRFRHFIGVGQSCLWENATTTSHTILSILTFSLAAFLFFYHIIKSKINNFLNLFSVLLITLLLLFSVIHAWFVYSEFRYVIVTVPFLIATFSCMVYELLNLLIPQKDKLKCN